MDITYIWDEIISWWENQKQIRLITYAILILALLIAAILPIVVIAQRSKGIDGFTEFYIQDSSGRASNFPDEILVDELFTINMVITNHEGSTVEYSIIVKSADQVIVSVPPFSLINGESFSHSLEFALSNSGNRQMIEFILIRQGYTSPYRNLHLYVDAKPSDAK